MCHNAKLRKFFTITLYFERLRSFKLVISACYDKQYVYAYL